MSEKPVRTLYENKLADEQIEELKAKIVQLTDRLSGLSQSYKGANEQINDMHATHKAEVERLREYATHKPLCQHVDGSGVMPCDCGWDALDAKEASDE